MVSMSDKDTAVPEAASIGSIPDLRDYIDDQKADEIVTAMEERRGSLPVGPLLACKLGGVLIRDFSTFMERETGIVDLDGLNPSWIIYGDRGSWGSLDQIAKRVFDIVASLLLLGFTLPILLVTAIAVKLTSKGPVFYRQERVGYGGRPFMLFKFRSMRTDAEADGSPKWAQKNDPRTTSVGRFIRLTRIDEIPQIINVLRGEMSFVGPRPERPFFVNSLSEELPYYEERHAVKPGITGWAQLNYPYGATTEDAKRKLQYDLYYIKNYSLFLDILILLQTARVILFPVGFAR
jgi:sugar transferase (PEP-CTERM system associated)